MNAMNASVATLAALGVVGVASNATATTTFTLSSPLSSDGYISIDNSNPQYIYKGPIFGLSTYSAQGELSSAEEAGTPAFDTNDADYATKYGVGGLSAGFIDLQFVNGGGDTEYGYATFNASGDLTSIATNVNDSVVTITAVPEPSTWALLIAGAGAMGVTMHRRRRKERQAVAA